MRAAGISGSFLLRFAIRGGRSIFPIEIAARFPPVTRATMFRIVERFSNEVLNGIEMNGPVKRRTDGP